MIKGILFDKDGTLLKFDTLWIEATRQVLPRFLEACHVQCNKNRLQRLLEVLGILGNQITGKSALAWMSYWEIAEVLVRELEKEEIAVPTDAGMLLEQFYKEEVMTKNAKIEPVTELIPFFEWLKNQGIIVGIATADTKDVTMHCLKMLGIDSYFSYIGTSGKEIRPKPYTDLFDVFCRQYHLSGDETAIVGDTPADMQFARNCGAVAVGVLSGSSKREDLEQNADFILEDVSGIKTVWNKINLFSRENTCAL